MAPIVSKRFNARDWSRTSTPLLAASGCHPKTAQQLLRYTDINLTLSKYSNVLRGQEAQAIGNLPDLSAPPKIHQKKTGTDDATADENVLALRLAPKREKERIKVNGNEQIGTGDIERVNLANQGLECKKPQSQAHKPALPKEGLEPSPCCQDGILNPARLPIPPLRLLAAYYCQTRNLCQPKIPSRIGCSLDIPY